MTTKQRSKPVSAQSKRAIEMVMKRKMKNLRRLLAVQAVDALNAARKNGPQATR
jgi:hypothetical protein